MGARQIRSLKKTAPVVADDSESLPVAKHPGSGPIIGIDLGTTNSCAAVVKDGKPFVIPSREGYNTIPSVVALSDKGKLMVGHPARSQLLINPRNTVYGAKRDVPVRLRDGRLLAIECKVSNGAKNSWKRLNREIAGR